MATNPYEHYGNQQIQTAGPVQLLLMSYDVSIRFLKQSAEFIEKGQLEEANRKLISVQNIIFELIKALDHNFEQAKTLEKMYYYLIHQLIQANMQKNIEIITQCINIMMELRKAWGEASRLV